MEWHIRMTEEEEAVVCCLLHTAEYCRWGREGRRAAATGWEGQSLEVAEGAAASGVQYWGINATIQV
jgi:hypothetical protein